MKTDKPKQTPVSLIVACTNNGGIAYGNQIPWHISADLKKFKKITTSCSSPDKQNAVIMGRNTWESIGRRLSNRLNIVVTSQYDYAVKNDNKVIIAHSIMSALAYCNKPEIESIFIIGGTSLYNTFLQASAYLNMVDSIYMSVMFYDKSHIVNKFIDMHSIFNNFTLVKDTAYNKEANDRLFASYICLPKKSNYCLTQKGLNINGFSSSLCEM